MIAVIAAEGLPVQLATRALGVSASGYYEWRGRAPSARAVRHAWLTEQIQAVHLASRGTYGSRRVHAELTLGLGITVGHGAIEMPMRRAGIKGLPGNHRPRPGTRAPPPVTWCTASSPARARTSYGSPTSPSTPPAKARSAAPSSSTPSPAGSWAGPSMPPRPPRWSPAPWTWPSATASPSPAW